MMTTTDAQNVSLQVTKLSKSFSTATGELEILQDVELNLTRGDAIAITGPSGCGKSTLLYILGALDTPTAGKVQLLGKDVFSLTTAEQAEFRNQNVGFVFQDHHLLPQCNVLENVLLPTMPAAVETKEVESRARELLQKVGLAERLDHYPAQLSGGERQRVAVCRALINDPVLILADEPTGNLDPKTADAVGSLLLELGKEQNAILICVTHSPELASRFPKDVELQAGQLAAV